VASRISICMRLAPGDLRLNKAKDAGLIPERAYCQVYETEDIATELRH
jgi:hypothetical protein